MIEPSYTETQATARPPLVPEVASPTAPDRRDPTARPKRTRLAHIVLARTVHRTVLSVLAHDCLNLAQSTAYSGIVALFPTLIVAAAVIGLLPDSAPLRFQLGVFFDRVLPPGVSPLLAAYFQNAPRNDHSVRALLGAGIVSFAGASNLIATLMEGFRRAEDQPRDTWGFWQRRVRSCLLVPLSLLPFAVASLMVAFGHAFTMWLASGIGPEIRASVYAVAVLLRWGFALSASVVLIALIYHLGVAPPHLGVAPHLGALAAEGTGIESERPESGGAESGPAGSWFAQSRSKSLLNSMLNTLPGAAVATAMWFLTTLAFGWYVTRFANYSQVYGSLGAGIALLFWLYLISLSVLSGAEFNAQFRRHVRG